MVTKPRRGVLLLVVLALLAMFAMVAVAFVVLTGAERTDARIASGRSDAVTDSAAKTLNKPSTSSSAACPSIPSGTLRPSSAITWQSLLEKIYGFQTIGTLNSPATMTQPTPIYSGQLIEFTLPTSNPDTNLYPGDTIDPFHYVGCVLTMLNGPDAGLSTRIVGINPQNYKVQIVAFDGGVQPARPAINTSSTAFPTAEWDSASIPTAAGWGRCRCCRTLRRRVGTAPRA